MHDEFFWTDTEIAVFKTDIFTQNPLYIDLQWFAAEDDGRTEEPTERKREKAREEEGRVVKSQELVGAVGILLPALALLFLRRIFYELLAKCCFFSLPVPPRWTL